MTPGRTFAMLLSAVLLLSACATQAGQHDDGAGVRPQANASDTAITIAKRESPLRAVTEEQVTQFLPIRRVVIGTDQAGRGLVVWVRGGVERYVYLDQIKLTSREQALTAAARQGVAPEQVHRAVLAYLDRGNQPVIWEIVTADQELWIDAITGEAIPRK